MLKSVKPTEEATDKKNVDLAEFGLTYADLGRLRTTIPTVTSATPMREFRKTLWRIRTADLWFGGAWLRG